MNVQELSRANGWLGGLCKTRPWVSDREKDLWQRANRVNAFWIWLRINLRNIVNENWNDDDVAFRSLEGTQRTRRETGLTGTIKLPETNGWGGDHHTRLKAVWANVRGWLIYFTATHTCILGSTWAFVLFIVA